MTIKTISDDDCRRALAVRDLSDPAQGPHAMQRLVREVTAALAASWGCRLLLHRGPAVVSVAENYDRLGYPAGAAARDARYTRYVDERRCCGRPDVGDDPAAAPTLAGERARGRAARLPGPRLPARRDRPAAHRRAAPARPVASAARRAARPRELERDDRAVVVRRCLPGRRHRVAPRRAPLHARGLADRRVGIDGRRGSEIGECGLAVPARARGRQARPPARYSGLAMGLGLDRMLMLRKGIDDIRLLRSARPARRRRRCSTSSATPRSRPSRR